MRAIKCDRCGKFDNASGCSKLRRADINFSDLFGRHCYPDEVDLCVTCTRELLGFIERWAEDGRQGEK